MTNQFGETGAFFFTAVTNLIIIEDSSFSHGSATFGGAFYSMIFSTFVIRRSVITDCSATSEGSVAQIRDSSFLLEQVTMTNARTILSNGAFHLVQSSLNVSESYFSNTQGNAIIGTTSFITVHNSTFELIMAIYGSAINCIDCTSLVITSNIFTNNLAQKGGAIYSFTTGIMLERLNSVYSGNVFTNNRAATGGAIYSESMHFEMKNNVFVNNSADSAYYLFDGLQKQRGEGGAVYSVCAYLVFCSETISNNTFVRNSAEVKGGAIYWADYFPIINNNYMRDNSAVYGDDVASFPIKLVMMSKNNTFANYLNSEAVPLVASLDNVGSGHVLEQTLKFGLVDHYDHIVSIDNLSGAQLFTDDTVLNIGGTTLVLATAGVFTFTQLIFNGQPTSTQHFRVTTTGVDILQKVLSGDVTPYYPTVTVDIKFRECIMGESLQGTDCYLCPSGTYSLDPNESCNSCPSHVTCYGNFTMAPNPGYWRPDPTTILVLQCPLKEACIGSPSNASYVSLTGLCANGYEGNLCTACQVGFSKQGKYQCGKCPNLMANIAISALIAGVALLFGALIVVLALRGATRPRSELALYTKIFMNYLQMIVVAASLNLNWPSFVSVFLSGQETAGSVTEQLFSYDCIMQEMSMTRLYYTKVIAYALMPAALILFAIFVWLLIRVCFNVGELIQKSIATLVLIIFVLHPSLSKMMFSVFSCQAIKPGEYWLVSDLSLPCWSSDHIGYILMVSVPSLAVWIFGLPTICLFLLYKKKAVLLTDHITQLKFSFLYKGYHAQWYFWEFVILYRKVAVVCASVFLSTVSITVQALSVLAVLLIALFFQLQVQPFLSPQFNTLELKSILVSAVTIYSGLFYQTEKISEC
jgi:predicted outer membrane repeat protein